jgi:RNA polymerase sigma-70 factor (ECF subfamily)
MLQESPEESAVPASDDAALDAAVRSFLAEEPGAVAHLLPVLYGRLRSLAAMHLAGERTGHTLQPTALVHEAFLKLVSSETRFADVEHFLAVASQSMRRVLVDHARGRRRAKRGGGAMRTSLDAVHVAAASTLDVGTDLADLDDAMARLGAIDPTSARIVEMRYFAGMEEREIANVLGMSDRSVRRHWTHAKAWLARELGATAENRR